MQRREFLTASAVAGLTAASQIAKADILVPGRRPGPGPRQPVPPKPAPPKPHPPVPRVKHPAPPIPPKPVAPRYVILEMFFTPSLQKRNALVANFDTHLIPKRNVLGFDKVGVFTINEELMREERGYDAARYDNAVFVVQECESLDDLVSMQERSAKSGRQFNLLDDLDFVDEEMIAIRSLSCQPRISVPYRNPDRVLQLRTYNSPNYERNAAKAQMFERGELDLFRRCGMEPVFMGTALFGTWVPNITYMLSFENDDARRAGWDMFVKHPEWSQMSKDPRYARTATRIRNLFLRPSRASQI